MTPPITRPAGGVTPAAILAMLTGDIANAIVASTPGGIEAQESRGQMEIVHAVRLPREMKNGASSDGLRAMGFTLTDSADELFYDAVLPSGWTYMPTDHAMWSYLCDETGAKRFAVFYKSAFYDRRAFLRPASEVAS